MTAEHAPLPVKGYTGQTQDAIALANEGKELEERYLRWLDKLGLINNSHNAQLHPRMMKGEAGYEHPPIDPRFLALARTHIQDGAMWAIRAIFQPTRIALPEDVKPVAAEIDGDGA